MTAQVLHVVARFAARPERVEELRAVLSALIEPTRREPGCIRYQLLQNRTDPTDLTFVEEWASEAALEAHLASAHIQEAIGKLTELVVDSPDIRRYSLIG